ncbi:MAG: beta-propeller fold lactonase family protein [Deltaproteobacteria bacterium]|nr:beta-propeller fold lactonase family protein [Deltaproteobacteria bacterium]
MINRRILQILPLFLITALVIQLSFLKKCYADAFAYIPNGGDDTVSIIKISDNTITADIPVGDGPFGVATSEEYLYVTNESVGTVSIISETFNMSIDTLDAGTSPRGIAATSDGSYLYIANYTENTISIIDTSTKTRNPIGVGLNPIGVSVSPINDYVYVTNSGDDSLSIISVESQELFVTLKNHYYLYYTNDTEDIAFDAPYGVAVSSNGYYVYVVNNGNNTISVIYNGTVYSTGEDFDWDDYDADNDEEGPYNLYEPISVGNDPRGVVVTPDTNYLYVTNYGDDTVSVISLSSWAVTETITVGDGPYGISITPSGDFVYVVNELSGNVSVIYTDHDDEGDYDDNTVVATLDIGNSPIGFGNFIGGKTPRKPTSLVADLEDTNTITVTWNDNSDDELGFRLIRKRYISGTFTVIATIDANITEYTDSDLENDSNYYYKVCAYNHAGDSDYSDQDYATTGNEDAGCFIGTITSGLSIKAHVKVLMTLLDRLLSGS